MLSFLRKTRTFPIIGIGSRVIDCKKFSATSQNFEIIISEGENNARKHHDKGVDILLLGYSGSRLQYLQKHSLMYNSLGYRTIACAFPFEYIFHFDIEGIEVVCDRILDKLTKERMSKVVPVCFSNNGAIYYQFLSQKILRGECSDVNIVGAVFDSAPGPVLGKFSMMFPEEDPEKPSPPNKFQLMIALLFVSKANRFSNQMTLRLLWDQINNMKDNPDHSFPDHYFKYQDKSLWPKFFIHSEADKLIPWQFISSIVQENSSRGQSVEAWRVKDAGHCAIMKMFPDLYREKIETFLDKIN